jgi:hypothetical protein
MGVIKQLQQKWAPRLVGISLHGKFTNLQSTHCQSSCSYFCISFFLVNIEIAITCMWSLLQAHRTNLATEALDDLPVVSQIKDMVTSLYGFFAHSPKRHLEFQKLVEVMQAKGLMILKNIKTRWISMLSPSVRVMNKYKVLLLKMHGDSKAPMTEGKTKVPKDKKLQRLAQANLAHLSDI